MTGRKNFLKSKGVWGGLIALGGSVANVAGYAIDGATVSEAILNVNSIVGAVGGLMAIYGRVTAKDRIG